MKHRRSGVPVVPVIPLLNPDEKLISVVDGLFACGFGVVSYRPEVRSAHPLF